jgi:GntR family transcriptional regulator/MocR family aminotransferase
LERELREAILSGALREGARLPASRVLAAELGVSRGVVSDAYSQLEVQGFLRVRARSAPTVATVAQRDGAERVAKREASPVPRYDLTPTTPDVALFPLGRWLAASQRFARRAETAILGYRDPAGEPALRSALADHLGRTRGVVADPAQIVIVQGTAQGVDLLLRVLRAADKTTFAVEDPSHPTQQERARSLGFDLRSQRVDEHGMIVAGLDAEAVLVTPAHQFPVGCVMSGERRRELLAWSSATGGLVIEDDYDSEFRYDREPAGALQGLAPDQVVQLGTVSKTLAPALRLGWIVAPHDLAAELAGMKRLLDDFSPVLEQLTFAQFLASGQYYRHLRRARIVYRRRRDALYQALSRHLPAAKVSGVAAGLHVLVGLPAGVNDAEVAADLERAGIRVAPLSSFFVAPPDRGGLVIGYGRLHESGAATMVRALAAVVRRSFADA